MGYDTFTTISFDAVNASDCVSDETLKDVKFFITHDLALPVDYDNGDSVELGFIRWHEREKDMYAISTKFPNVLFTVYGDGEDSDDVWYEYWINGKRDVSVATWRPFNPRRLRGYNPVEGRFEGDIPLAYSDHRKDGTADRLFEMSELEISDRGNRILQWLQNHSKCSADEIMRRVRIAYDADSASSMFTALTGVKIEDLLESSDVSENDFDGMF